MVRTRAELVSVRVRPAGWPAYARRRSLVGEFKPAERAKVFFLFLSHSFQLNSTQRNSSAFLDDVA